MGYAERLNARTHDVAEHGNGHEPDPSRHAAWCQRFASITAPCTCYPIPALRCEDCQAVFTAAPGETALELHARCRAHSMVHPGAVPKFSIGTIAKPAADGERT